MIPHARPDARLGEFEQHRGDAADAERDRILVDAPLDAVGRQQRGITERRREIDRRPQIIILHRQTRHVSDLLRSRNPRSSPRFADGWRSARRRWHRSEETTSKLQSLMRISY